MSIVLRLQPTLTLLAEFRCALDGHSGGIWLKSTPCTGVLTRGNVLQTLRCPLTKYFIRHQPCSLHLKAGNGYKGKLDCVLVTSPKAPHPVMTFHNSSLTSRSRSFSLHPSKVIVIYINPLLYKHQRMYAQEMRLLRRIHIELHISACPLGVFVYRGEMWVGKYTKWSHLLF